MGDNVIPLGYKVEIRKQKEKFAKMNHGVLDSSGYLMVHFFGKIVETVEFMTSSCRGLGQTWFNFHLDPCRSKLNCHADLGISFFFFLFWLVCSI